MSNKKEKSFFGINEGKYNNFAGFEELAKEVSTFIEAVADPQKALVIGAKEFVKDLKRLPKPMSKIRKTGYTHLVSTFSYRKKKGEVEVGWGKYYGPMVEYGTIRMDEITHLRPCWDRNKEKYYEKMLMGIGIDPFFFY